MKLRDSTRWDTFKCIFGPGMACLVARSLRSVHTNGNCCSEQVS